MTKVTDEKSISRDLFSVKNISIGIVIVLLLPIPISLIISSGNWLSFIDGNSTVWIGFWGSYLGGIIGTIGVIFVAHLQNKEQARLNDKTIKQQLRDIKEVEDNNKERLKIEIKIGLYKEYIKNVHNIHAECKKISRLSYQLIGNEESFNGFSGGDTIYGTLKNQRKAIINEIKEYDNDYFLTLFDEIAFSNMVLRDENSSLQEPLNSDYLKDIDDLLDILNSEDLIRSVQLKFKEETINKENYIQKMHELHSSFDELFKWTFFEVAYSNRDVGNLLKNLNSNK